MALFTKNLNETKKTVTLEDFNMIMDSCTDNLGEFYAQGIIGSLWWTAVSTMYFALENMNGKHAPSYIETMEQRLQDGQALGQYVLYWLQDHGNDPDLSEELNEVFAVIITEPCERTIRQDEMFEESAIFKPFGLKDTMMPLELDKVYEDTQAWFVQQRLDKNRDDGALDGLKEFDETVRLILLARTAAAESAKKQTRQLVEQFVPISAIGIEPEYAHVLITKIDNKIDGYLQKSKKARRKDAREGNPKSLHSVNVALLTAQQELIAKILHEADDVDKSNTVTEIVDDAQNKLSQNLDVPANFEYNQEQNAPQ